jgi:hypothetical protein
MADAEAAMRMKQSVIVWDLETVPDLGGFAAVNDLSPTWRCARRPHRWQ